MTSPKDDLLPPSYLGGPQITGENCHREAIHIPGSIQPHGALLVVRAENEGTPHEVLQASENLGEFLEIGPAAALGQPLEALFGPQVSRGIVQALPLGTTDRLQYRTTLQTPTPLALTAHRVEERLVLEIEAFPAESSEDNNHLRNAVFALESAQTLAGLLETAAEAARNLSGFDRVMLYRFAEDNSGEVVAESCRADLAPFLGHRFPESDIPAQARALYVRHALRLTADVGAAPSPLTPRLDPLTQAPTPLGGAVLRATSPMHLHYLRNMGVASSLSVSIVVDGRLWGLISCHHHTPRVTSPSVRAALEEVGRLLNLQIQLKEQADVAVFRQQLAAGHQQVLDTAARTLSPLQALSDPALGLSELLRAGGVALRLEGEWRTLGATPPAEGLEKLLAWLQAGEDEFLLVTDHLGSRLAEAGAWTDVASGLLAVSIGRGWQEAVLWFRGEQPQVALWGGATPDHAKTELGPRQSFATYIEDIRGHAEPWHTGEIAEAQALARGLSATLGERLSTLRKLNDDLTRSNEEWRKFAFVISHDLQEPVRLIGQFMDLFRLRQGDNLDEQTAQLTHYVNRETARIGSLTADLYTYTELLSYPELNLQAISLSDLLRQTLADLAPLAESKQLKFSGPTKDLILNVDGPKLQLALGHVIRNALTFGRVPVQLSVSAEEAAGQVTLKVQDNGPGVPKEYQERLFELFQRLGKAGTAEGNGVGLTLARKVAELHGGTLTMQSTLGQGTTLTFVLPSPPASTGLAT